MPRYSAEQIYGFARQAGFSPDEAATMTAIALAESGGNGRAHNPHGENSQGLWQINGRAHPSFLTKYDLFDPADNAKAAFEVSHRGADISPWTVTHGGAGARYLHYREQAQDAAVAYGEGHNRGMWTGTAGYKHTASAAAPGLGEATPLTAAGPESPALQRFLEVARAQVGDRYVFGAEVKMDDANPNTWDCSEFTQWAAHQAGAKLDDGATAQYLQLKKAGLVVDPEQAKNIPGALLFSFDREPRPGDGRVSGAHVAISLGDGKVVEAANPRAGVRESTAGTRFQYAAVIPGISDGTATPLPPTDPAMGRPTPPLGGPDTDRDGLSDLLERRQGLDPLNADTDRDHLGDAEELVTTGTDARRADTDGDRLDDAFELALGLDPMAPDTDDDGHLDGSTAADRVDTDGDGLDDSLESLLGTDPMLADSDLDGYVDSLERHSGSNPLDARVDPLSDADAGADPVLP
jgi:cell wall-associated NlpC family hydrolase